MSDPAFPHKCCKVFIPDDLRNDPRIHDIAVDCVGLTKREYAAIAAMQGALANEQLFQRIVSQDPADWSLLARFCCNHADALLSALEKKA